MEGRVKKEGVIESEAGSKYIFFSNLDLRKLIIPLILEQILSITLGWRIRLWYPPWEKRQDI